MTPCQIREKPDRREEVRIFWRSGPGVQTIRFRMNDRIYTEEEVAAIFASAAERQRARSRKDLSTGLTLEEIEQVGLEAGLDADAIRDAAAALDVQRQFPRSPRIAVAERWIDDPLPAGAWEDIVASLRQEFGSSSSWWARDTASIGHAEEWKHTSGSGLTTTVTVSPRQNRTLMRVVQEESGFDDERRTGWLIAAFIGLAPAVVTGAVVAETLAFGDLIGIAAMVLVFLAVVAVGGPWLTSRVRSGRERRAEKVQQVADILSDQILKAESRSEFRAPSEAVTSDHVATPGLPIPDVERPSAHRASERGRTRS
jgi:hypothetical protein